MKNLHAIEVRVYPATNKSGTRVGIISKRFNQRIIINYTYQFDGIINFAINYLTKKGFNIVAKSFFGDSDIILSDTFKPLK